MTTFNDTYDTNTPQGSDDPAEADDKMREIKAATQERENVDHYWPLTGTEVSDADAGEHRKVTLRTGSAPTAVADKGFVYAKDVGGKAELFYRDEDGNEVQITSAGKILSASLDMKDEDDMSSDSATHAATQQSIKAFAEGNGYPSIDGTPTAVFTKYFTGTLDADSSTSVAHGITGIDNILHVAVVISNAQVPESYIVSGFRDAVTDGFTHEVFFDGTNVVIQSVGATIQGEKYRIKIDYKL